MKHQQLRKRLLIESGIVIAVLGIIGGATYFVSSLRDDYASRKNAMEGQVSAVTNESNALREKFIRIQKDKNLYDLVMTMNDSDMLSHSSGLADKKLKEYESAYNFNSWTLDSSVSQLALEDAKYKRKTHLIIPRDAIFNVEALTDEHIYDMMTAMQGEFPGAVSFTSLKLTRQSMLTDEALRTITQKGSAPLIKGEIKFTWFGIDPVDPEEAKKQAVSRARRRR